MTRSYSEDIREHSLARGDAGETVRSIAQALQISPSCVTKWKNLRRQTGGLAPGKIGAHKMPVLSYASGDGPRLGRFLAEG
jgi:transposase